MQISISERNNIKQYEGEVEFIIIDKHGREIRSLRQKNIIKIYAKEILSHRLPYHKVWDPNGGTGTGAWITHSIDIEEYAPKYIVFGASYDQNGNPLDTSDTRYYIQDNTGRYVAKQLNVGAEYDGGLINAIPIAEPNRPLKKVERIYYESSYQPAGSPLLDTDVRAMNNIIVFETTLRKDEYNGFVSTSSDFFTITEVALVGAAELDSVGTCNCDPRDIFLTGNNGVPFLVNCSGTATVSLDISESQVDAIKEGDTVKIVDYNSTAAQDDIIEQLNPYYLVINKSLGGRDITLDRTPVNSNGDTIIGQVGLFRDGFKMFSHRILSSPIKKSNDFEIICRWRIIMN